jgi:hypothetical protein
MLDQELHLKMNTVASSEINSEFDTEQFEKKLVELKDTQESIQHLSAWCLQRRTHHKKIAISWLNVLKQGTLLKIFRIRGVTADHFSIFLAKIEHRLTLFYLANDVIQNSKRRNYEFVDSWGTYIQKATTLVR